MDCDGVALLLAAADGRPLVDAPPGFREHLRSCRTCEQLASEAGTGGLRWVARIPEDALDDRDLLVLPTVDPIVFEGGPELARGGMGRILRARDRRLGREVAIKEVLSPGMRARFEREVAITAKLQHPAIVPVYEAGAWPDGTVFYAMRLVSGGTLQDAIDRAGTLEARLALLPKVIAVTDALAYAHERRIVHRDLKPGNVLVGEHGETVVIDWGLAKELGRPEVRGERAERAEAAGAERGDTLPTMPAGDISEDATLAAGNASTVATVPASPARAAAPGDTPSAALTVAGAVMGTPCFMAPEQAGGADVDERADVYALGAILYTVLAGAPPYLAARGGRTPTQLVALSLEEPPVPIADLAPRAPLDLRVIVERAMARDPAARYANANAMADELRRFESGQLLRSREYGARELVSRWVRRHRAAVIAGILAFAAVAAVGISALVGISRSRAAERDARAAAERARDLAEANVTTLLEEQGREALLAGDAPRALGHLVEALSRGRDTPALRYMLAAASRDRDLLEVTTGPAGAVLVAVALTPSGALAAISVGPAPAISLWTGATRTASHPLPDHIVVARLDADGRRAAIKLADGGVSIYEVATGARLWGTAELRLFFEDPQLDPRGARFLGTVFDPKAEPGFTRRDVELRDAATGARLTSLGAPGVAAFSADGARAAACSDGGVCRLWDAATGRLLSTARALRPWPTMIALLGGDRLVIGTAEHAAELLHFGAADGDAPGAASIDLPGHRGGVHAIATTAIGPGGEGGPAEPGGVRIATGDAEGAVRLWSATGALVGELRDHRGKLGTLAFSPDGARLLGGGAERRVYLWDTAARARIAAIDAFRGSPTPSYSTDPPARAAPHGVLWRSDGARLVTLGFEEDRASIWRAPAGHRLRAFSEPSAAGGTVLVSVEPGAAAIRTLSSLELRARCELGLPPTRTDEQLHHHTAITSRDDRRAVVWHGAARRAFTCDLETGRRLAELSLATVSWHQPTLKLSADGRYVLEVPHFAVDAPPLRILDTATGRTVRELRLPYIASASLSADGELVAIARAGVDHPALWRVSTGQLSPLTELPTDLYGVSFDPTGRRLAVFGGTRTAVIDPRTARIECDLTRPVAVGALAPAGPLVEEDVYWDGAGRRFATRSADRVVSLWDATTGARLGAVEDVPPDGVALSADGALLATATFDGAVRIWDAAPARLLEVIRADGRGGMAWSADGARLIATGEDGVTTVWDVHRESRTAAQLAP